MISGTDNSPLAGVMIYVEGTTAGTITNGDGSYTFTIPAKSKYVTFSYVGFDTKKLHVEDTELFKLVSLAEQSNALDEVVVIGYGTQKKESMVASITSVKPSDLNITSSSLTTAFAGNIAGMISRQTSGEPGYDSASFYIRGISTFGSSNSPLIILDGVEVLSNMLNNMPPESIESFSVLKDAQATSVYGSRGANGVILINTKNGRNSEKMNVSVRLENTFSMPTMVQQVADGVTYMQLYNEAVFNTAKETGTLHAYQPFYSADKINGTKAGLNKYLYPNNDWYDLMFKDFSVNQNLNLNIRGGGRKVSYFLNAFLDAQYGMIPAMQEAAGHARTSWYTTPGPWPFILTFANLWKNVGYSTVLYLAAITGIDTNQYEAAAIDGATKWQQVLHVTIPHLRTMIAILFIMNVGKIFASDFGLFYQVPMNSGPLLDVTNTIDTYVYRGLMSLNNISMASAAGVYQSLIGFLLVLAANFIVKKSSSENALF